ARQAGGPDRPRRLSQTTTRSTTSGTSAAGHRAERKYSKRYQPSVTLAKKAEVTSPLGPDECANHASSGFARSQMKRLVPPPTGRGRAPIGAATDGLTV